MAASPNPWESRLLDLLAQGQSIAQMARGLEVSRSSVNRRLLDLRERYDATNNVHLAAIAARQGWL